MTEPSFPSWESTDGDAWDAATIDGTEAPGVWSVKVSRARSWDRKAAQGAHGETQTYKGTKAADVTLTWRVDADEWDSGDVQSVIDHLEPPPTKETPKPVRFGHPVLDVRKIEQIQVDKIDGPDARDGFAVFTFACFEFYPKPAGANGSGTSKGESTACATQRNLRDKMSVEMSNALLRGDSAGAAAAQAEVLRLSQWLADNCKEHKNAPSSADKGTT